MATTQVANGSDLNITRVQEKLISTIAERENLFANLIGTSMDSPFQRITDLQKHSGDTVKYHLGAKLSADGVDGDSTLEGNEESLTFYHDSLLIDQKRHAVRIDGQMTEQRSAIDLRSRAKDALGGWARDFMTEVLTYYISGARGARYAAGANVLDTTFTGFAGNSLVAPDTGHWLVNTSNGASSGTMANMTTAFLDKAVKKIKLLVNNSAAMRPMTSKGRKLFAAFLTPEQIYDLRNDSNWEAAQQNANVRGEENPLFSGAAGYWNGLAIFENPCGVLINSGETGPDGTAYSAAIARGVIVGAQACGIAFGKSGALEGNWKYIEKDTFDYYNSVGFAIASIMGVKKLRFNSMDYGVFTLDTGYTA